jgi:PAS domain S-box-containing protein
MASSSGACSDRPNDTAEVTPVAIIVTDVGGRVLYWSSGAEQLYGWTAEETLGRHLDFLAGEEVSDQVELIFAQLSQGELWQGRFPLRRKDGRPVEVDARDIPIEIDGVVAAILGESRAVSEHDPSEPMTTSLPASVSLDSIVGATARWYEQFLARSGSALSDTVLDEVLFDVLSPLAEALGADAISLLVADEEGSALISRAAFGWKAELEEQVVIPAGRGVSGRVMSSRRPLIIDELDEVEVVSPALRQSGFHSYVGVPLIASDRVVGVLHATSYLPNRFDESHAASLAALAPHLAAAIDRVRRFEREQEGRRAARAHRRAAGSRRAPATAAGDGGPRTRRSLYAGRCWGRRRRLVQRLRPPGRQRRPSSSGTWPGTASKPSPARRCSATLCSPTSTRAIHPQRLSRGSRPLSPGWRGAAMCRSWRPCSSPATTRRRAGSSAPRRAIHPGSTFVGRQGPSSEDPTRRSARAFPRSSSSPSTSSRWNTATSSSCTPTA